MAAMPQPGESGPGDPAHRPPEEPSRVAAERAAPQREFAPTDHLSSEAVAAFADDRLGATARARALRHLGQCRECMDAVHVQRSARIALRASAPIHIPDELAERITRLAPRGACGTDPVATGSASVQDDDAARSRHAVTPSHDVASSRGGRDGARCGADGGIVVRWLRKLRDRGVAGCERGAGESADGADPDGRNR